MGTKIDPIEPGLACLNCWGAGKPFGPGETPKRVFAEVEGVLPGSLWERNGSPRLDGTFLLQQVSACLWKFNSGGYTVQWRLLPTSTVFSYAYWTGIIETEMHDAHIWTPCLTTLPNGFSKYADTTAYGGVAEIHWEVD